VTLFDRLEDSANETGEAAWVQIGHHLLATMWIDDSLYWVLDGELVTREEARRIVEAVT
jgi:hypothetical protein